MSDPRLDQIRGLIRDVPDFPKPGILFKDISPLLGHGQGFRHSVDLLAELASEFEVDVIAGPEARGFVFGAPLATKMGLGFAPIRKMGKLPWKTIEETYDLEYGTDTLQMHEDAVSKGQRVLLVDDLLATGGTIAACRRLAEKSG
ncbi:MAG: adenine phosphoribosyltransferase, partial [Planctomycetes bacterium]|nr:adenine phosphoribosyltransferase [Planctomycetota bacterium]